MADPAKLARVLRVRTLQLGLAQADEMRARAAHEQESALSSRIARLAEQVSPVEDRAAGFSLAAAAHYDRVRTAEAEAARAAEATRAAKRDQSAVEKLIERGLAEAALREIRALRDAPPVRKIRHDPC